MTRINSGVDPTELTDKHLIAEHREIIRIPNKVRSGRFNMIGQPKFFTLGDGHVKFFYDKLHYLFRRYVQIYKECKRRGFNVGWYGSCWENLPVQYLNDYQPTGCDRLLVTIRIKERLGILCTESDSI